MMDISQVDSLIQLIITICVSTIKLNHFLSFFVLYHHFLWPPSHRPFLLFFIPLFSVFEHYRVIVSSSEGFCNCWGSRTVKSQGRGQELQSQMDHSSISFHWWNWEGKKGGRETNTDGQTNHGKSKPKQMWWQQEMDTQTDEQEQNKVNRKKFYVHLFIRLLSSNTW